MTNSKIKKIDQLINRTNMQKNKLLHQEKRAQMSSRKSRTRTLIQIGGLLEKANLLEEFDIGLKVAKIMLIRKNHLKK